MSILVDTNLLTRIAQPSSAQNLIASESVKRLLGKGENLHVVPQNVYEFWVVATRPLANNGLGMTTQEANAKLEELLRVLTLLPDAPAIFPEWQRLVVDLDCKGKTAHDARLAAAMIVHKLASILTFNVQDFTRFPGITVLDPSELAK